MIIARTYSLGRAFLFSVVFSILFMLVLFFTGLLKKIDREENTIYADRSEYLYQAKKPSQFSRRMHPTEVH